MNRVKWVLVSFLSVLALGLATPAVAQDEDRRVLNDSQEPGSVLVFHKFLTGTVSSNEETFPRTEIEISVTCPKGSLCAEFTPVKLKAHWVCPGRQDPEFKFICEEVDFILFSTVNGTLSFGPGFGGAPVPPCSDGYLIVWVVDFFDRPIKYDSLIGDAIIRDSGASAGAYNAIPIQAARTLQTGVLTDVDNAGDLDFDGTEYQAVTGKVFGTVRYERAGTAALGRIESFLTLLTLDVKSNRPNFPTFVDFNFYTEFEQLISTFTEFICYRQVRLTDISPTLTEGALFSRKGLFESVQAEKVPIFGVDDEGGPVTLLAIVETLEFNAAGNLVRQYSYSTYNDSKPVPTAFQP